MENRADILAEWLDYFSNQSVKMLDIVQQTCYVDNKKRESHRSGLPYEQKRNRKRRIKKKMEVSPATMAKISKNKYVSCEVIDKICSAMNCQPGDILEHIKEQKVIMYLPREPMGRLCQPLRYKRKGLVLMVTYSELFQFVTMLCAVITLVILVSRKKQRPRSGKLRRYFCNIYLPAARCILVIGSLVKYIIALFIFSFKS